MSHKWKTDSSCKTQKQFHICFAPLSHLWKGDTVKNTSPRARGGGGKRGRRERGVGEKEGEERERERRGRGRGEIGGWGGGGGGGEGRVEKVMEREAQLIYMPVFW